MSAGYEGGNYAAIYINGTPVAFPYNENNP